MASMVTWRLCQIYRNAMLFKGLGHSSYESRVAPFFFLSKLRKKTKQAYPRNKDTTFSPSSVLLLLSCGKRKFLDGISTFPFSSSSYIISTSLILSRINFRCRLERVSYLCLSVFVPSGQTQEFCS